DVRLAAVNAGQLENVASDDSLTGIAALLALQLAMGLPGEEPAITLSDSLAPPADSVGLAVAEPLPVAAARASLRSAAPPPLLASADRVAAMSLQAYAEGAIPLANVLEAQRNAREALGRYIDDLAAAHTAIALVRLMTAAPDQP